MSIHNPKECQEKLSQNDEFINKRTTTHIENQMNIKQMKRSLEQDHYKIKKNMKLRTHKASTTPVNQNIM